MRDLGYDLLNHPPIILVCVLDLKKFVSGKRSASNEKVERMNEDRCCKKIVLEKPVGKWTSGRSPLRWIDYVEKDINILKVKNWKTVAKSRDAWRNLLKAKGHSGLSSH
ncbi:hypothetical protein TNCV_2032531 [Trichonephila clavipes]|nr:hypothetical protein TNCV_2032531 [Trichonephila clavipes]